MPISVACQCGQKFAAKDELAGKRVKCPKCGTALTIGRPRVPAAPRQHRAPVVGGGLDDLFDDVGIPQQPLSSGPKCPSCGTTVAPGAVICVQCGFNSQTGQRISSQVVQADGGFDASKMSEAEYRIAMAEKDLAENLTEEKSTDYGDGKKIGAYVLALFLPILFLGCIAVIVAWGLSQRGVVGGIMAAVEDGRYELVFPIAFFGTGLLLFGHGYLYVSLTALERNVYHGLASLFTFGGYATVYGVIDWENAKFNAMVLYAGVWLLLLSLVSVMAIEVVQGGAPLVALPLALLFGGLFTAWLGYLRIGVTAMRQSVVKGLLSLMIPFYCCVFGGMNWSECKTNMILIFVGIGVLLLGFILLLVFGIAAVTLDMQGILESGGPAME